MTSLISPLLMITVQAFCRLCAVFGGVYYLGKTVSSLVVREEMVTGVLIENKIIRCSHLIIPASQVPGSTRSQTTSRAVFLSSQSMAPGDKEQITFLSLPQDTGTPINLMEVGAGAAATPRGLHLLHAAGEGTLDLELVCKTKELVKEESLLYSLTFSQIVHEAGDKKFSNLWSASGPSHELDFDLAIQSARDIYRGMYPEEDFLPRAPDPDEIVFGEEEDATAQEESEAKDGADVESGAEKTIEGDIEAGGDEKTGHSEDGDLTRADKDCDVSK